MQARQSVRKAWADALRPEEPITACEWADRHRRLSGKAASEPGPYRSARTPYVREPLECLSIIDPTEQVTLMWGTQLGKSETGNNWIGYIIDCAPGPALIVLPRTEDAEDYSKERIDPMIEATPRLSKKIADKRDRDGGNNVRSKHFPGGVLGLTGGNSAAGLKSKPRRYLFLDEVDEYPLDLGKQGDPITLAKKRQDSFGRRKKRLVTSTPTIKGASRIEREYEMSDKRRYWVPCPDCAEFQTLEFKQLEWPKGNPQAAKYICAHCGSVLGDEHKTEMLERGEWRAETPGEGRSAGFHLNSLYSPVGWFSWVDIANAWEDAQGDQLLLKTFINTILAETWAERGEAPDWERLYERRENFPLGTCPKGVLFLTIGADVQKDRIEYFVWGWGRGKESWLVDYDVIDGDPYRDETWGPISDLLNKSWDHEEGGTLPLARMAVDSNYATDAVVSWVQRSKDPRVMAIRGDHWKNWTFVIGGPSRADVAVNGKRTGVRLFPVGGALIKQETYAFLRLPVPLDGESYPEGFVHLPMVDDEVVKQLVGEDLITNTNKYGRMVREWQKNRARNEALDCRVYARAAAEQLGISRFTDDQLNQMAAAVRVAAQKNTTPKRRPPAQSNYATGRGGGRGNRKVWLK